MPSRRQWSTDLQEPQNIDISHKNGFSQTDKNRSKFAYTGCSMRGTLCRGDIVHVDSVSIKSIRTGDIIVYTAQAQDELKTIHRVVSVSPEGLVTQGDNCPTPDPHLVTKKELIGKVSSVERDGKLRKIAEGTTGLRHAKRLRFIRQLKIILYPALRPIYFCMGKAIVKRLKWQPQIHQIQVATPSGKVTKFIHNNKTVAYWNPRIEEWQCKKPYDLVLSFLPPAPLERTAE